MHNIMLGYEKNMLVLSAAAVVPHLSYRTWRYINDTCAWIQTLCGAAAQLHRRYNTLNHELSIPLLAADSGTAVMLVLGTDMDENKK